MPPKKPVPVKKSPAKKAASPKAPAKRAASPKAPAKKTASPKAPAKKAASPKAPIKRAASPTTKSSTPITELFKEIDSEKEAQVYRWMLLNPDYNIKDDAYRILKHIMDRLKSHKLLYLMYIPGKVERNYVQQSLDSIFDTFVKMGLLDKLSDEEKEKIIYESVLQPTSMMFQSLWENGLAKDYIDNNTDKFDKFVAKHWENISHLVRKELNILAIEKHKKAKEEDEKNRIKLTPAQRKKSKQVKDDRMQRLLLGENEEKGYYMTWMLYFKPIASDGTVKVSITKIINEEESYDEESGITIEDGVIEKPLTQKEMNTIVFSGPIELKMDDVVQNIEPNTKNGITLEHVLNKIYENYLLNIYDELPEDIPDETEVLNHSYFEGLAEERGIYRVRIGS